MKVLMMINKKILLFAVLSVTMLTGLSAAHIRDIFASGINATGTVTFGGDGHVEEEGDVTIVTPLISNSNGGNTCTFDDPTRDTQCLPTNTRRVLANTIVFPDLTNAPIAENTTAGTTVIVPPGNYSLVNGKKGTIEFSAGVYYIDEFTMSLAGDLQVVGEGTAIIYVRSTLNVSGSNINCDPTTDLPGVGNTSDKVVIYSADPISEASQACIAGYLYLTGTLKNANMQIYGALSANEITLTNGGLVRTNLADIPFADIGDLGETGESFPQGWRMIGIPANLTSGTVTVSSVFGDDGFGTYGTNWAVYKRDYNTGTFATSYTQLTEASFLEQGRGYWLVNSTLTNWNVFGLTPVIWDTSDLHDATTNPNGSCMSGFGCYTHTLTSCELGDTSSYLYNLVGYLGGQTAAWQDFRVVVTDTSGTSTPMSPTEANIANIINNTIWTYDTNGSLDTVSSGAYLPCDDTGIVGSCDINSTQGFWVEVNCTNSIGKTIDLIIPNGK